MPYAIKLMDSVLTLLFKPGFTIRFDDSDNNIGFNINGIDDQVIWSGGLATLGEVRN